jgi:hypothetical protein
MLSVFLGMLCSIESAGRGRAEPLYEFVEVPYPFLGTFHEESRGHHALHRVLFIALTTPRLRRGRAVPFFKPRDALAAIPSGLREARRVLGATLCVFAPATSS